MNKKFQFVFETKTKNENLKSSLWKKVRFALYSYFVHVAEFTDTLSYRFVPKPSAVVPHTETLCLCCFGMFIKI